MVEKEFERDRLVFKPFSTLTDDEKKIIVKSWENPFNARYNKTKDANESVEKISRLAQPTFKKLEQYEDCMYFRAVFDKTTGELIGNCRFGKYYKSKTNECWDFGFNVLLKHWLKGYGTEIIGKIIDFARGEGVKTLNGGADIENYASYKAMINNGFEYMGYDEDGDYKYVLDLSKALKKKDDIYITWQEHLERTKTDLGEDKFNRLQNINKKIIEMVKRIQKGEDEDVLVNRYFEALNQIETFKFS